MSQATPRVDILTVFAVCALMLLGGHAVAQDPESYRGDPYTLSVCSVSGAELGSMGDPILLNHEGRDIRLCCAGCKPKFAAEPAKYISMIDAMMVEAQLPLYPLDTDIVSGDALGDEPIDVVHNNRLVRFSSQMSAQKFYRAPDSYLAKLDEAVIAAQVESYPLDTCVITGEPLDAMGKPVQIVAGNRLVQFCCEGCEAKFWKNPQAAFLKLGGGHSAKSDEEGSDHK